MTAVGVIPARYAASRFPGKPLVSIAGVPMIERVWRGARGAKSLDRVLVATDDERIASNKDWAFCVFIADSSADGDGRFWGIRRFSPQKAFAKSYADISKAVARR